MHTGQSTDLFSVSVSVIHEVTTTEASKRFFLIYRESPYPADAAAAETQQKQHAEHINKIEKQPIKIQKFTQPSIYHH
jgi:hypothetical protein